MLKINRNKCIVKKNVALGDRIKFQEYQGFREVTIGKKRKANLLLACFSSYIRILFGLGSVQY